MDIKTFQAQIKKNRLSMIPKPKKIIEEAIQNSSFYEESPSYFLGNSTDVLYEIRSQCWETYLIHEKNFNIKMGQLLVKQDHTLNEYDNKTAEEVISYFLEQYSDYLFELSKSNTNSRRARAGKEFESIVETILLRAGILFDNQGIIGSKLFTTERLGKLVDCVVPGVIEYNLERRKCTLISMKTSLRERWQEVPEEMKRTGAQEMFLLTLDDGISKNTIESLSSHNITLVVPDNLKSDSYEQYLSVYGLTQFLYELVDINDYWIRRKDLPSSYYENKLQVIKMRLDDLNDPYEKAIFERMEQHCKERLNK